MDEKANKPSIRFTRFVVEWKQCKLGELIQPYSDPVVTPTDGYFRLGIRSHAKGTFHNYVKPGMELETARMHRVSSNNFIVNITFGWEHAVAVTDENDAGKLVSHRFPQFSFNEGIVSQYFKYLILDEKFRYHLWLSSPGGAGRNRVLKISEMLEFQFWITSEEEQSQIGSFLRNLDSLIILHQRKHDKLVNIKKSMLEKMFPQHGADVPEIRFAGFTDSWERRKLGEAFLLEVSNNTLSRAELNYEKGEVKSVHYGDILIKYGAYIDTSQEEIPYITGGKSQDYTMQLLREGDIIFADTAEDETTGKASEIVKLNGDSVVSGLHTMVCRPLEKKAPYYLGYYLNSDSYHRQLLPLMQGIKVLSLSRANLVKTFIQYPKEENEQAQIGFFFRHLDTLITIHQRKLTKLQNIKKSCLEKMFV